MFIIEIEMWVDTINSHRHDRIQSQMAEPLQLDVCRVVDDRSQLPRKFLDTVAGIRATAKSILALVSVCFLTRWPLVEGRRRNVSSLTNDCATSAARKERRSVLSVIAQFIAAGSARRRIGTIHIDLFANF
jgi:hypothetical protein